MKRLFTVFALITSLIGSIGICLARDLDVTNNAGDWLKAAKMPAREINAESTSLLTEGERRDLLTALAYAAGYRRGFTAGATSAGQWGVEKTTVMKFLDGCLFLNSPGDTYDEVRDYLIANPSARNESTTFAFTRAFKAACGVK